MRISIFDNQHEAVKELPEERQGAFWTAFFSYVFDGVEPCFSEPMERMAWNLVKPYIEKSITAGQNGKKGGRKPNQKTKPGNQAKNQNGNQTRKAVLSENENEREGLGVSLKDTLNPSLGGAGAGGDGPAPRPACLSEKDMAEQSAIVSEMEANAVPCPAEVEALVAEVLG